MFCNIKHQLNWMIVNTNFPFLLAAAWNRIMFCADLVWGRWCWNLWWICWYFLFSISFYCSFFIYMFILDRQCENVCWWFACWEKRQYWKMTLYIVILFMIYFHQLWLSTFWTIRYLVTSLSRRFHGWHGRWLWPYCE